MLIVFFYNYKSFKCEQINAESFDRESIAMLKLCENIISLKRQNHFYNESRNLTFNDMKYATYIKPKIENLLYRSNIIPTENAFADLFFFSGKQNLIIVDWSIWICLLGIHVQKKHIY